MNTTTYEPTASDIGMGYLFALLPLALLIALTEQTVLLYRDSLYRRVITDFLGGNYTDLESRAEKVRKKLGPNRRGKMKRRNAESYNNLCHVLASLALFRGDEDAFFDRISEVEFEEEYALRPFTLALYYLSKGEQDVAAEHYCDFQACPQQDDAMQIVMDHLFDPESVEEEDLHDALRRFKNPATLYLLEKVGLLENGEEDDE